MKLQVKNKVDGKVYPIHKYILSADGIESVWCNDWYGHHRIGFDCEWATHDRAKVLVDALEWIKTYGPVDELTVKFIDKALEQWEGKEVGDENK